jgi:hypothetical protein
LNEIDCYAKNIFETAYNYWYDPLIIVTIDHGGIGNSHGGNMHKEKNAQKLHWIISFLILKVFLVVQLIDIKNLLHHILINSIDD